MIINKAFKYRMYPTKEQEILFAQTFGCCRFIYNKMLADKIKHYELTGEVLYTDPAKYKQEYPFLKEVDSRALLGANEALKTAYKNFFEKRTKHPKFKSKKYSKQSYTTYNTHNSKDTIRIENNHIRLPKIGFVKIKYHRPIPPEYKIKNATITKNPSGKYYVNVCVEYEYEYPAPILNKDNSIGLDYSSPDFYVDNQGKKPNYPKYFKQAEEKLAKEQRRLSHMVKDSKNWEKQRIKVARCYEKVSNQRQDWLHKLSYYFAETYDYVFVEDLNLLEIAGTLKLGKSTNDNGFGMFRLFLEYKMKNRGKIFHKIDKWFASSKICHYCGYIKEDLTLNDREWICPNCGELIYRDWNSAINILNQGFKELGI